MNLSPVTSRVTREFFCVNRCHPNRPRPRRAHHRLRPATPRHQASSVRTRSLSSGVPPPRPSVDRSLPPLGTLRRWVRSLQSSTILQPTAPQRRRPAAAPRRTAPRPCGSATLTATWPRAPPPRVLVAPTSRPPRRPARVSPVSDRGGPRMTPPPDQDARLPYGTRRSIASHVGGPSDEARPASVAPARRSNRACGVAALLRAEGSAYAHHVTDARALQPSTTKPQLGPALLSTPS